MSTYSGDTKRPAARIESIEPLTSPSPTPKAKPTFWQKVKAHFKKWWWLHIIIFCACFLLIALLLVYVGLPNFMQDGINASSLSITAITYLSPTSTSFLFSQSAIVHNTNIFTPTLDPFNATLYLVSANGTLFPDALTTITIPAIHALDNSQVNITNTPITIADEAAVSEYCIAVLTQKNVTNRLVGRTNVHLGGLPVNTVDYNQDVTYAGMNSLEGFNVTDVRINITAAEGEPNLSGVAVIPNPSVLTFEMGNVTLAISTSTSTTSLGNTTIPNLTLVPGLNHFPLTGHLNISATSAVTNGTGYVNLLLRGESVVYDGVDLSYYVAALQAQALELVLNVRQVLEDSGH